MSFYRYLDEWQVHVVDCAGPVDLQTGLARLEFLARELEARPAPDGVSRLLIDFRNTVWASDEVHLQLSAITRRDFGLNAQNSSLRAAILNARSSGAVSDNEHWFVEEDAALAWLVRSALA